MTRVPCALLLAVFSTLAISPVATAAPSAIDPEASWSVGDAGPEGVRVRLAAVGRPGAPLDAASAAEDVAAEAVPLPGDALAVRIVVERRLEGAGPLVLTWDVEAAAQWAEGGGRSVMLLPAGGGPAVRVTVSARDAGGEDLAPVLELADGVLTIVVEDDLATYPVALSASLATASWSVEGEQESAFLGVWVAPAGDVNADGFDDVAVGAYQHDHGEEDEGRAYVFHGSATGLAPTPAWTGEGDQAGAFYGRRVAGAGDVNNDGFDDLLVAATAFGNGEPGEGRVLLYLGTPAGLETHPAWSFDGDEEGAALGISIAAAGDVDADGFDDVIVGGVGFDDDGSADAGRVFLFRGSAGGLQVTPAWTYDGGQFEEYLGLRACGAGDVNRDGYADVIVGAPGYDGDAQDEGRALLFLGSASGLFPDPSWTMTGGQAGASFGYSLAPAGDIDGDGFADVLVGARTYTAIAAGEGGVFLYLGSVAGLEPTPAWTASGGQAGASFGVSAAGAGDVNQDGRPDVIVGAYTWDGGQADEGRVAVYLNSANGLAATPGWAIEGDQADARLGFSVAAAGDVNADGVADVIAGAHFFDGGLTDEGRAVAYYGPLSAPPFALWLPAANAPVEASVAPQFRWFPGDRAKFRIEWSNSASFGKTVKSGWTTASSTTPTAKVWAKVMKQAQKTGRLYWRVCAKNAKGKKGYSEVRPLTLP
ncbi:MAG: FG-GAP repeat protein [Acidobacteria bacterium]|nr:FG-GAP repeat protein [Acidobacteriota bacterium]